MNPLSKLLTVMSGAKPLQVRLKEWYAVQGYDWQPENLIILRKTDIPNDNTFQDCLAVVTDSGVFACIGTGVYGTKWTKETRAKYKISQEGNIVSGFYRNVWKFGMHNGKAFVQCGPLDWFVDANLNKKLDKGETVVKRDICAINIHRKTVDGAKYIDFSSAGCPNPRYHADMDTMAELCGWTEKTPPAKKFHALITESENFPFAKEFFKAIRAR